MITDNFTDVTKLTDRAKRTAASDLPLIGHRHTQKGKNSHGYPLRRSDPSWGHNLGKDKPMSIKCTGDLNR